MTVTADEKRMVQLPSAQPGDRFDLQIAPDGKYVLTLLESTHPHEANVWIEKENGYTVGRVGHKVDQKVVDELLRDVP